MTQDEHAIILRILDGDEHDYGLLIDRYKDSLYRHCFKFMRDEEWAQDVAQEAFIKAYLELDAYNPKYRFSTWLFKIATNIALGELRKKRTVPLADDFEIESQLADTDQIAKDTELYRAVQKLPQPQQQAITLHYWHGKNYEQIADILGTTTGSIKGWMSRAKKELRRALS